MYVSINGSGVNAGFATRADLTATEIKSDKKTKSLLWSKMHRYV